MNCQIFRKEGVILKVKPISGGHMLVVLSQSESDRLGILPGFDIQSFPTRLILARIFEAACVRCHYVPRGSKVDIRVRLRDNGETILLFSEPRVKKYRIKEDNRPILCRFVDCDGVILLWKRLEQAPKARMQLYYGEEHFAAVLWQPREELRAIRAFFGEYGDIKIASRRKLEAMIENYQLIGEHVLHRA